jgi:phage baseplate assembly protein W
MDGDDLSIQGVPVMEEWVMLDSLPSAVVFGAAGIMEIMQNVRTILTTPKGTQPLDRDFGISLGFLDSPVLETRARAEQECFLAIRKYEPRAVIKKIRWDTDIAGGKFWPDILIQVVSQ